MTVSRILAGDRPPDRIEAILDTIELGRQLGPRSDDSEEEGRLTVPRKRRVSLRTATKSVVTVGGGRGFVTEGPRGLVIVTAAHCLGDLPPAHSWAYQHERYRKLVAPIDKPPAIIVESLFVDPVADLAVVGPVDGQQWPEEEDAYNELVEAALPLPIANCRNGPAWLLSLAGDWYQCTVSHNGGRLSISNPDRNTKRSARVKGRAPSAREPA